jgi:N-methylhydantoinase A
MIIGIDVGGTHADGVLLKAGEVLNKNKVYIDQADLQTGILTLLESLLPENLKDLREIHLSTTVCTNAIVNDEFAPVGMLIQAGPGVNPDYFSCGDHLYQLDGIIDHRGHSLREPSRAVIDDCISELRSKDITSIGIATKFSHRNNSHELLVQQHLNSSFSYISLGHKISGLPNFPRRVYTTWLNSALMSRFVQFKESMEQSLQGMGITCPCYILKADGGTIPFSRGCDFPCQSIHSGPSASVMGALALCDNLKDALLLDIGGTTTDIAIFSDSIPLLEPFGATVGGRPTLIRALQTKSIGLGGDSTVKYGETGFSIGPDKKGPPMALGGPVPTPTDAMIVLDSVKLGSKERAVEAMEKLIPGGQPRETATLLLQAFVQGIRWAAEEMLTDIFSRPVYTVSELLNREKIHPDKIVAIGGPALALKDFLSRSWNLDCIIPQDYEVANAIGAARARITAQASLYADSAAGCLSIPEISCMEPIDRSFSMSTAEKRLVKEITRMAKEMGMHESPQVDIIEREEMNTVRGFSTTGKTISLKGQTRPGLLKTGGGLWQSICRKQ